MSRRWFVPFVEAGYAIWLVTRRRSTVLPDIEMPVLLIVGDRDRFFPTEVVEETVHLIPECTLVTTRVKAT